VEELKAYCGFSYTACIQAKFHYVVTSALAVPARIALPAALFIDDRSLAALGTQVADAREQGQVRGGGLRGRDVNRSAIAVPRRDVARLFAGEAGAALRPHVDVAVEDLRDAVGQRAHAVGAEAERAPATDAGELALHLIEALEGFDSGGHAQDVGDQAAHGF
jgi:hypothetical protein